MILIIFGRALQFLLALLTIKVATTLLTPEEMGKVSLILTTTAFFALFFINPVGMFINRRLHTWCERGLAIDYLLKYFYYITFVSLIASIVVILGVFIGWLSFGISLVWLIFLVCASLFFNTINQTSIPSLNLLGNSRDFVILSLITASLSFAFAIALVFFFKKSANFWLLGILLGQCLVGLMGSGILFSYLKKYSQQISGTYLNSKKVKFLFDFAWPLSIAAGLGWVQYQGYRYLIQGELGLGMLGLFVAGYSISAGVMAGFESILTTYFQPKLYRSINTNLFSDRTIAWKNYASVIIPAVIIHSIAMIIVAPELAKIFLGENFQAASNFIVWGALAESARVLINVYGMIAHVHMNTKWLIIPNIVGGFFSIGLCFLLMPFLGAHGAGIALALAGLAVLLTMHIMFKKHVDGGIGLSFFLKSCVSGLILWMCSEVIRKYANIPVQFMVILIFTIVGVAYIWLQYKNIKPYIESNR